MFKKVLKSRYPQFVVGSLSVFLFEYLLTIFLTEVFMIRENLSYLIAIILGIGLIFFYHHKITFKTKTKNYSRTGMKFASLNIIYYAINWYLVYSLNRHIKYAFFLDRHFNYLIIIPVVSILLSLFSYLISDKWIFKD